MVIDAATEVAIGTHLLFVVVKLNPIIPFRIAQPTRYAVTSKYIRSLGWNRLKIKNLTSLRWTFTHLAQQQKQDAMKDSYEPVHN